MGADPGWKCHGNVIYRMQQRDAGDRFRHPVASLRVSRVRGFGEPVVSSRQRVRVGVGQRVSYRPLPHGRVSDRIESGRVSVSAAPSLWGSG